MTHDETPPDETPPWRDAAAFGSSDFWILLEFGIRPPALFCSSQSSAFNLQPLLPNCLSPIVVQATLGISSSILDAAALGFLGLGAQPPQPEWGTMLATTIRSGLLLQAWWLMFFPGLAILLAVLGLNLLGDALRDALDPSLRRL